MHSYRIAGMVVVVALLFLGGCHRPDPDMTDRLIVGEVMLNSEFKTNLRALCLSGGRLSGTANGHQAEQFVAEKLRDYGLDNVHLQQFEMPGWQVNETIVTVLTDPPMVLANAVALCNTQTTPPDGLTGELTDGGDGSAENLDQLGSALAGKFALVRGGKPNRRETMRHARERGALGVLYIGEKDREPVIGGCHPEPRPEPGIAIRYDDGVKLAELLAAGETVRLNVKVQAEIWEARPHNAIGEIPGSGPLAREIVILCAHLDSWHLAEGAIDNANGSATILETARALKAVGWRPRRTVRFVWFMGEEQDLFGSKAYVAAHQKELDGIVAVINIDMPGAPRRLIAFGHAEIEAFLKSVTGRLAGYEIAERISKSTGSWSDHAPFMNAGVCALTLRGDLGDGAGNYHTINDKYEIVDRRKTVQSAAVLGVLVRQLADCPERPSQRLTPREQ